VAETEKIREIEKPKEREKTFERIKKEGEKEKPEGEERIVECPECGSRQLVHDYERAELVCNECGLVVDEDFIDMGPEWRAFDTTSV
jgi:transcription initiation factor TFIIB